MINTVPGLDHTNGEGCAGEKQSLPYSAMKIYSTMSLEPLQNFMRSYITGITRCHQHRRLKLNFISKEILAKHQLDLNPEFGSRCEQVRCLRRAHNRSSFRWSIITRPPASQTTQPTNSPKQSQTPTHKVTPSSQRTLSLNNAHLVKRE